MIKYLYIPVLLSLILMSCRHDHTATPPDPNDTHLTVTLQPMWGNDLLYIDSVYTTSEGYLVKFENLKCFMENVRNDTEVLIDAGLFDYAARGTKVFQTQADPSKFGSLEANLGVDSHINHNDPTAFPSNSWLNILNANDMHWNWSPGYIFIKVEAKVDTIPDANQVFDHTVVFHVGGDANIQSLSFQNVNWMKDNDTTYHLPLKLDMSKFLQNGSSIIDLKNEFLSHTGPGEEAISLKVMQNFAAAILP